jgi:hypothetical protein
MNPLDDMTWEQRFWEAFALSVRLDGELERMREELSRSAFVPQTQVTLLERLKVISLRKCAAKAHKVKLANAQKQVARHLKRTGKGSDAVTL